MTKEAVGNTYKAPQNEALLWADTEHVYKHTDLDNAMDFSFFNAFCPDGTHPGTDLTGESNKIIASVYIHELRKIFGRN